MPKSKYTKEFLEPIVKKSISMSGVLKELGLQPSGSQYMYLKNKIQILGINTDHFKGQGWSRNQKLSPKTSILDYLNNIKYTGSTYLKDRLISEKYFEAKCYCCQQTHWMNEPIPLELHHINNNHFDNNLSNLTILCANCHSLQHKKNKTKPSKNKCICCQKNISKTATRCKSCAAKFYNHNTRIHKPSKEQLQQDIIDLKNNKCAIGRKYNVSDNSIRKWIISYNL